METLKFMNTVLGEHGHFCIFAAKDGKVKQKFYQTKEQAWNSAKRFDKDGFDAYYGLGTFDDAGKRRSENVSQMGSLFLDMDCGEEKAADGKGYVSQAEALGALRDFVKSSSLPRPLMVSSGHGVHVYWPLSEAVPVSEWKPVALALKKACRRAGLLVDPAVPADAARVLRLPGTHNRKNGHPVPVEVIGTGAVTSHSIEHYADIFGVEEEVSTPKGLFESVKASAHDDPMMQRLMGNRTSSFKAIITKSFNGRGCAHIKEAVENPADVEEPMWRAVLSIAKPCEDGAKGAHIVSRGHPGYDADATDEKLSGIKGPYTCETFDSLCGGVCDNCPLKGKITSPIQIGSTLDEAETEEVGGEDPVAVYKDTCGEIPQFPKGYARGKQGGVYRLDINDDGDAEHVLVFPYDFYYIGRVLDPEMGECVVARLHLPNDKTREFTVPLFVATSREEIRKALSRNGLTVPSKRWESIMAYTQDWIDKLQNTEEADTARTQFGWTDDTMTSYVLGDREIFADRQEYNPPSSKTSFMFPSLRKKGTLEGWKQQAEFYNREGLEPYQYVICHAFAAPLMRLTPLRAAIFDFYSDGSGHGKTTTQQFALTIYGEPGGLIVGPKDTFNHRMNRMELMKDVNLQYDEFTEFPAQHTSDLIYGITDGRQKGRMASGSNDERFRGEPWATTVTSSSNYSMLAKVYAMKSSPKAEVQRVLRYHVQPYNFTDKRETDEFAMGVGQHYGHAIDVFIQYILQNKMMVKELLESVQRKLDKACDLNMSNRFWSAQGAVTVTALILAKEAGLVNYDVGKLFAWTVKLILDNKRAAKEAIAPIESIITEFVIEHYGEVLWIKSTDTLRGTNGNALDELVTPEMQPRGKLAARYETDTKFLFIACAPFKQWCTKRRLNYDSVVDEATGKFKGGVKKMRIARGTKMNLPATNVLELDCSGLDMEDVLVAGQEG